MEHGGCLPDIQPMGGQALPARSTMGESPLSVVVLYYLDKLDDILTPNYSSGRVFRILYPERTSGDLEAGLQFSILKLWKLEKHYTVEDEMEMATVRHRPEALELLEAQSKFTKKELQILYRGFKNGNKNENERFLSSRFNHLRYIYIPNSKNRASLKQIPHYLFIVSNFFQECPSGVVNEETFKEIYSQFFPQGDSTTYAHFLFNAFDTDHNGSVSFEVSDTVIFFSTLSLMF
ncbi:UNVERIFIED_CONTAM: hypothetical protein H355_003347 [Colinus virginianus]|nr:hypothetical protein H355_003347 [Colinus virginianus]